MNSYYFLHTRSLCNINYERYKTGLTELNALTIKMLDYEKRLKNEAIYHNPLYLKLLNDYAETGALIQFIEQCISDETDIDNDANFEANYPNKNAGFLGVNFTMETGIAYHRQVIDEASLFSCRQSFLDYQIKEGDSEQLPDLLGARFPYFSFSTEAQDDIRWWKSNNIKILECIILLLDDISHNPFTGGLGKTEVLGHTKNSVASKRITGKDRLTYTFGETTIIHRCKDHY